MGSKWGRQALAELCFVGYIATPSLGELPLSPANLLVLRGATSHGSLFSFAQGTFQRSYKFQPPRGSRGERIKLTPREQLKTKLEEVCHGST